jgi:hypothetical protein
VSIQDLDLGLFYQFNDGSTASVVRTMTDQLRTLTTAEPPPQPIEILSEGKDKDYLVLSRPGTYLVRIWNETQNSNCSDCELFERPAEFHLYIYTQGTTFSLEESSQASSAGCLINEAAGKVISIGAVGYTDAGWCVMPSSSLGPTDDARMKPDFVAPDRYESKAWGGYFAGTSAATPLAAGVAALTLSRWPDLTLEELVSAMTHGATPLCGTLEQNGPCEEGHTSNNVVGHGLVNALETSVYLNAPIPCCPPPIPTPVPVPPCQEVARWSGNGIKQTETFSIQESKWRISWKTTREDSAGAGILIVDVYNASGMFVFEAANERGIDSGVSYVNAQPGLFYLEISSNSVDWEVVVEDCTD